jgi:hypothetical protein
MRLAFLLPLLAVFCGPVHAQSNPVVVELFTSQGCDSCPPADRILGMLAERADVIALSLHVDYWDYLGWTDTLSMPAFTKRQRAFAKALGERTVFTPQAIVQGSASVVGSYERDLEREIRHQAAQPVLVNLSADRDPDKVSISLSPTGASAPASVIYCVEYSPLETVDIERGENSGERIDYANVVKAWNKIGEWDGKGATTITAPLVGGMPVVVIVQEKGTGPILAAAKVR